MMPRYIQTSLHFVTAVVIQTTKARIVRRRTLFQRRIGQWRRPRIIYNNKQLQAQAQHRLHQHKNKRTMNSPNKVEEPLVLSHRGAREHPRVDVLHPGRDGTQCKSICTTTTQDVVTTPIRYCWTVRPLSTYSAIRIS